MSMMMGMGHWLLWAVAAIIGVAALISIVGWMRREKEQGVANTQNSAETLADITNEPVDQRSDATDYTRTVRHEEANHQGWGFWPWALLSLLVMGGLAWLIWNSSMAPGAGAFKWILWALIPMAGLISILGISQMTRRHPLVDEKKGRPRGLGFLTLISGLVLGLASWFIWQPRVASFDGLQGDITTLKAENDGLSSKLTSRKTVIDRLQGEVELEALKYAELEEDYNNSNTSHEGEIGRLNGIIAGLKGQVNTGQSNGDEISKLTARISELTSDKENLGTENARMNGLIGTYKNDSEVQGAKISSLEAELAAMRNKPAPEPTTRTLVKKRSTPLAMMHRYNQDETKLRLTSGDYNMVKRGHTELVNGKRGRYYNIALRNPADGKAYKFASASYNEIVNDTAFKQSLDRVISDIRGAFDGKRAYQIYVQGKASAGGYNGKMADGFDYSKLTALKNLGGSYGPDLVEKSYGPDISNDDLPNLRSAYLQEYVAKNYKVNKPIILDGKVSKSKKLSKRAVALILFVED